MMIASEHGKLSVYRGAYKPVNVYKNTKQIGGFELQPVSGTAAEIENTYDTVAEELIVVGRSEYDPNVGDPSKDPAPDNIRPIITAKGTVISRGGIAEPYEANSVSFPELRAVEGGNDTNSQYKEIDANGTVHYYIADTVEENKLIRRIGVKEFTGTENYSYRSPLSGDESVCCDTMINDAIVNSNGNHQANLLKGYLNIGAVTRLNNLANYTTTFAYNGNVYHYLKIAKSAIPDWADSDTDAQKIEKYKAYLADMYRKGTPVTVYYVLAQPVIQVLDQPLIRTFPKHTEITVLPDENRPSYRLGGGVKVVKQG